jgi:hypothetical protein
MAATGKEYETPKEWWDWWRDSNEYESREHPVEYRYFTGVDNRFYGRPEDTYRSVPSCFVRGTPVWTKLGLRPIETLEVGDLVLSQDIKTGELDYKYIIGRTIRPSSGVLKVSLASEEITATKGHPFWVAGMGWQMAKELADGSPLHSLNGGAIVQTIAPLPDAEAYNLIIADFSTYFVGESGLLVHDNTMRRSAPVLIPGVAAK